MLCLFLHVNPSRLNAFKTAGDPKYPKDDLLDLFDPA